jgi:hypothetical protein
MKARFISFQSIISFPLSTVPNLVESLSGAVKFKLNQVNEKLKLIDRNADMYIFVI